MTRCIVEELSLEQSKSQSFRLVRTELISKVSARPSEPKELLRFRQVLQSTSAHSFTTFIRLSSLGCNCNKPRTIVVTLSSIEASNFSTIRGLFSLSLLFSLRLTSLARQRKYMRTRSPTCPFETKILAIEKSIENSIETFLARLSIFHNSTVAQLVVSIHCRARNTQARYEQPVLS